MSYIYHIYIYMIYIYGIVMYSIIYQLIINRGSLKKPPRHTDGGNFLQLQLRLVSVHLRLGGWTWAMFGKLT